MTSLVDKVLVLDAALGDVPHAFGGAIALAFATEEPRGTRDIDVNVFVAADSADVVFAALPDGVHVDDQSRDLAARDEQVRLWWDDTPVDVFFAAHRLHMEMAGRCRRMPFRESTIPVLAANDLAVFKVLFDRSKDWVDIEAMLDSGTLDLDVVIGEVILLLGDDQRIARLRGLARRPAAR